MQCCCVEWFRASKYLPFLVQTLDIATALVNNVWRATTPEEALANLLVDLRVMTETHLKPPIKAILKESQVSQIIHMNSNM